MAGLVSHGEHAASLFAEGGGPCADIEPRTFAGGHSLHYAGGIHSSRSAVHSAPEHAHADFGAGGVIPLDSGSDLDCRKDLYVGKPEPAFAKPNFWMQGGLCLVAGKKASD